jgi:hypothetical protein
MRSSVSLIKALSAVAAILVLAAGCSSSPTAPAAEETVSEPSGARLSVYANIEG